MLDESRESMSSINNYGTGLNISTFGLNFNEQEIYKYYRVVDGLPDTHPRASIATLLGILATLWLLQRYF